MTSDWPTKKLSDLVTIKHGFAFKGEFFSDEPTSFVLTTPGNFAIGGGFQVGKKKYYSGSIPPDYQLMAGDLLVTMTDLSKQADTLGYSAVVPKGLPETYLHNQRVGLVQVKESAACLKKWVYYLMRTQSYRAWVVNSATGSTVKHTSPTKIGEFSFPLPPLYVQEKIVGVLDPLEKQIENLQHQNNALEAIAQRLFRSWFVNFDPVHAKAAGKEPEAMSAELAALFPSEFEDSELGPIPKGWAIHTVKELCTRVSNGATPSRSKPEYWGKGHSWFKTGELLDGFLLQAKEEITAAGLSGSSTKIFPRHSVLMAIYAAPTVGRLGILTEPACFNQAATGMLAKEYVGPWFLYQALKNGRAWFNGRSNGAAQQNISKEIVEGYKVISPCPSLFAGFNRVVAPLYRQMESNTVTCQKLSQLRDHLLPRLISGKLSVADAERMVEEATAA